MNLEGTRKKKEERENLEVVPVKISFRKRKKTKTNHRVNFTFNFNFFEGMKAVVLYDFEANVDNGELKLTADEEVTVLQTTIGDGWWEGKDKNGKTGIFPESYVQVRNITEGNMIKEDELRGVMKGLVREMIEREFPFSFFFFLIFFFFFSLFYSNFFEFFFFFHLPIAWLLTPPHSIPFFSGPRRCWRLG